MEMKGANWDHLEALLRLQVNLKPGAHDDIKMGFQFGIKCEEAPLQTGGSRNRRVTLIGES